MKEIKPTQVYLDPLSDYGFKRLFGEERNKALMIDFLNALLPLKEPIQSLTFINVELQGRSELERKAVVDVLCKLEDEQEVLVELQCEEQAHFLSRSLFYASQILQTQGKKGVWNYQLKGLYCICLLDFELDLPDLEAVEVVQLKNEKGTLTNPYLWFMYVQVPLFRLGLTELDSRLKKWLYLLKNVKNFDMVPEVFTKDALFFQFLEEAELAKLSPQERRVYEQKLKEYRDLYNILAFAEEKGLERGMEKSRALQRTMVVNLFKAGHEVKDIAKYCELSEAEVQAILKEAGLL